MGHYISIRGWLDYPDESKSEIQSIHTSYVQKFESYGMPKWRAELYNKGWNFPKEQVNWTSYLFYGADIREYHLDYIRDQMRELSRIYESDDDLKFFVEGRFDILDDESDQRYVWTLIDGKFTEETN